MNIRTCACNSQMNVRPATENNRVMQCTPQMSARPGIDNNGMVNKSAAFEKMSQIQLLNHINEVSFAVDDLLLYLDTHPGDMQALTYCQKMIKSRKVAMDVYSARFAPLTIDCTVESSSNRWEWIMQPWPWEPKQKGGCR